MGNKENENYIVALHDRFLKYDKGPDWYPPSHHAAAHHARVYVIGDKYFVKGLKEAAAEKFRYHIDNTYISSLLLETAEFIYGWTPKTDRLLRDIVAQKLYEDLEALGMSEEIDEVLQRTPDLESRILRCRYNENEPPRSRA